MLTIHERRKSPSAFDRRELLRVGALGAGGLTLANLLGIRAEARLSAWPRPPANADGYVQTAPPSGPDGDATALQDLPDRGD